MNVAEVTVTTRTTSTSVTFMRPFTLSGFDSPQPAGTYVVETDEERIEDLSFLAYRRTGTRIQLPPSPSQPGISETAAIDPAVIDQALAEGANQ